MIERRRKDPGANQKADSGGGAVEAGERSGSMNIAITMADFFPPRPVTMEDFYPHGITPVLRGPSRRFVAGAGAVLLSLTERLQTAAAAEIELLTITQFCHDLLKIQGMDFEMKRLVK